jgi:hypothetical protein
VFHVCRVRHRCLSRKRFYNLTPCVPLSFLRRGGGGF